VCGGGCVGGWNAGLVEVGGLLLESSDAGDFFPSDIGDPVDGGAFASPIAEIEEVEGHAVEIMRL